MIRERTTTEPREGLSSGEIREEIRRTRSDMDSTVIAIEERLTPGQLLDEAWQFFRRRRSESGGPSATSRLIRDHPLPVSLVGVGLGLLAAETMTGGDDAGPRRARPASGSEAGGGEGSNVKEALSDLGDRASGMKRSAGETVSGMGEQARNTAREAAGRVREGASAAGETVQQEARRVRRGVAHQIDENPLAVGAAALALGIAAGSLFPTSRWEDETMGETRDTLVREAKETGREAMDDAREVAAAAGEAARDEADRQGLTPEEI